MRKLYFGTTATTVTTLLLLGLFGFWTWSRLSPVDHWGLKSAFLLAYGLVICCYAAARDGLDKTIQCAIDGSCAPGLFPLVSLPNIIGCVGALVIIVAIVAIPIAKTQKVREIWFWVMSGGIMGKIAVLEVMRILHVS